MSSPDMPHPNRRPHGWRYSPKPRQNENTLMNRKRRIVDLIVPEAEAKLWQRAWDTKQPIMQSLPHVRTIPQNDGSAHVALFYPIEDYDLHLSILGSREELLSQIASELTSTACLALEFDQADREAMLVPIVDDETTFGPTTLVVRWTTEQIAQARACVLHGTGVLQEVKLARVRRRETAPFDIAVSLPESLFKQALRGVGRFDDPDEIATAIHAALVRTWQQQNPAPARVPPGAVPASTLVALARLRLDDPIPF